MTVAAYSAFLTLSWFREAWRRHLDDTEARILHVEHLIGSLDVVPLAEAGRVVAPPLAAPTASGSDFVLSGYRGGVVVLAFVAVDASGAPRDDASARVLEVALALHGDLGRAGLNVAVAIDGDLAAARLLLAARSALASVPVLHSLEPAVSRALGLASPESWPHLVVVGKRGRLRAGAPPRRDAPDALDGPDRFPFRPERAADVVATFDPLYLELVAFDGWRDDVARQLDAADLLSEPIAGAHRGLFRAVGPAGQTVGWVRAAHPPTPGCHACESPIVLVVLDGDGTVRAVVALPTASEPVDAAPFASQLVGLRWAEETALVFTAARLDDVVRRGLRPVDVRRYAGSSTTARAIHDAVVETRLLIERVEPSMPRPREAWEVGYDRADVVPCAGEDGR